MSIYYVPTEAKQARETEVVMGSLTEKEATAVKELSVRVADLKETHPLQCHPHTLVRFLRGRDLKLDKAEKMFRDSMAWRTSFDVEAKCQAFEDEMVAGVTPRAKFLTKYWFTGICGQDNQGMPVRSHVFR